MVREQMSLPDLNKEFPFLEDWFASQENSRAQIHENRRLMLAEEKLVLIGGEQQVKDNLQRIPRNWRDEYAVLLACRQDPMITLEIQRFGSLLGRPFGIPDQYMFMFNAISALKERGELTRVQGLASVSRSSDWGRFSIRRDIPGYLTTDHGLKAAAGKLATQSGIRLVGRPILIPTE